MPCNSGVLRSEEFVGELNGGLRIFEGRSTSGFMQLSARTEFIFTMEIYLDLHTDLPLNGNSALQIQPDDSTSTALKLNSARSGDTFRLQYIAVFLDNFRGDPNKRE
jgi:hypothetical protein